MTTIFDGILDRIESEKNHKPQGVQHDGGRLDVERYLPDHGQTIAKVKPHKGGVLYCLDHCVFDENHTSNEAAIFQGPDGKLTYQCFHESCKGRTWKDAREKTSGSISLAPWMSGNGNHRTRQIQPQPQPTKNRPVGNNGLQLTSEEVSEAMNRGEDGDAEIFIKQHRGEFCFDHTALQWFKFNGAHWQEDLIEESTGAVNSVSEVYLNEANHQGGRRIAATREGKTEDAETAEKYEAALLKRVLQLHSVNRKKNVKTLAAAGANSLGIAGQEWDQAPYLLPCKNGLVDLKTGESRKALPGDYIKTVAPTEWTGIDTLCPAWDRFLCEIFNGDLGMVAFVQRLLGYGITGNPLLHIILILYGAGRNGKGTFIETAKSVLGPLAYKTESELLLASKNPRQSGAPNAALLGLRSKRIVWASETDEGRRFNAGRVKELVGGDTLNCRGVFAKYNTEFKPTHLLMLLTNSKPGAAAGDYALWQRIHLIPFELSFVADPICC